MSKDKSTKHAWLVSNDTSFLLHHFFISEKYKKNIKDGFCNEMTKYIIFFYGNWGVEISFLIIFSKDNLVER
jgi:hypothetical protein